MNDLRIWKRPEQECHLERFNTDLEKSFVEESNMQEYINTLIIESTEYINQFKNQFN